ncbi:DUF4097 family beta strand repeat-containing protein [Paenibacillus ihumii]|uniref:DUF4097 family beta strand repeat-containing protein n=1 Tax=Paenibacillus ihumii TaxID=687436 RepID=UPI0006D77B61|nr:DUF4097 family beta strand repeat-containing protein [Paenibacillus ihumii]
MNRTRSKSRSRLNSITMTAAAVTLVVLAGCSSIQDKTEEAIGQAASSLEQSVIHVADKLEQRRTEAGMSRDISAAYEAGEASKLSLEHAVGNILISGYEGNEIRVNATIWFAKLTMPENRQQILDQAEVSVIEKDGQLRVVAHPKDDQNTSLWKWAHKKYGISDFMIDYAIEVPASLDNYDISNDVGIVELHDLAGSFDIQSDVGQIRLDNARIAGESSIRTSTGSVEIHILEMNEQSRLNAKTEVGNIEFNLDDAVQCTLVTKSEVGGIIGTQKGTTEINGGGGEILLQSEIGTIAVK